MVTCESALSLIAREPDGELTAGERHLLDRHTADCADCSSVREANLFVKPVLATRVDADVPRDFAARVRSRVHRDEELGWIAAIDWRRWTEWTVPVAAALVLGAVLAGAWQPVSQPEAATGTSAAEASYRADGEASVATEALSQDVTSEDLLAAMLGTGLAGNGGARDGR